MHKATFEAANALRLENGKQPKKKLKQSVLPFAPSQPTHSQVRKRIVAGVCPTIASPAVDDKDILTVYKAESLTHDREKEGMNAKRRKG